MLIVIEEHFNESCAHCTAMNKMLIFCICERQIIRFFCYRFIYKIWAAFEILKEKLKLELFSDIFAFFVFIFNDFAICQYFPVTADLYLRSFKS